MWRVETPGTWRHDKTADSPPVQDVIKYLSATWVRDQKELENRLLSLLVHLLNWEREPHKRSRNWRDTIARYAEELRELLAMPRKHFADETTENNLRDKVGRWPLKSEAAAMLQRVYAKAVRAVIAKTGMRGSRFPDFCPYSLEEVLQGPDGIEPDDTEREKEKRRSENEMRRSRRIGGKP